MGGKELALGAERLQRVARNIKPQGLFLPGQTLGLGELRQPRQDWGVRGAIPRGGRVRIRGVPKERALACLPLRLFKRSLMKGRIEGRQVLGAVAPNKVEGAGMNEGLEDAA